MIPHPRANLRNIWILFRAFTSRFWIQFLPSSILWFLGHRILQTEAMPKQLPRKEGKGFLRPVTPTELENVKVNVHRGHCENAFEGKEIRRRKPIP